MEERAVWLKAMDDGALGHNTQRISLSFTRRARRIVRFKRLIRRVSTARRRMAQRMKTRGWPRFIWYSARSLSIISRNLFSLDH
ncbi:hypothetical protein BIY27_20290 [Gibbsiella quercinecans]|nr:hypothetical protein BIY27_20290 [Gibbsiella quercinecans]